MPGKFVLLAGCLGRTLAAEIETRRAQFLGTRAICKPLLVCAGGCVLDYWIRQIKDCPRIEQILIVVSQEHLQLFTEWAKKRNFPVENLICNGARFETQQTPGDAQDLALALSSRPADSEEWVFCARADYCFEPEQSLRHFIESAILTVRPTVAMVPPDPVALDRGLGLSIQPDDSSFRDGSFMSNLLKQAGNTVRINSCTPQPGASAEWVSIPLFGVPPLLCKELKCAMSGGSSDCCPGPGSSLEQVLTEYSRTGALTGFKFQSIFGVRSLYQLLFTDHFFNHLQRRRAEVSAEANQEVIGSRMCVGPQVLLGAEESSVDLVGTAMGKLTVDVRQELDRFSFNEAAALVTRSQEAQCDMLLPSRFVKAGQWSYGTRRTQHPCYTTSNNGYGMKNPKTADMPMTWNGIKGEFTKHSDGAIRDKGLRCFTAMSKVHKAFDEYTHYR